MKYLVLVCAFIALSFSEPKDQDWVFMCHTYINGQANSIYENNGSYWRIDGLGRTFPMTESGAYDACDMVKR